MTSVPRKQPPAVHPFAGGHGPHGALMRQVERARDRRSTIRRLWGYLRPEGRLLAVVSAMVVVSVLLTLANPLLMVHAIDQCIKPRDLAGLGRTAVLMVLCALVSAAFTYAQGFIMAGVAQRTVRLLRRDLFARLQDLPLRFFDSRAQGDLMSRLTNDIDNVSGILGEGVTQVVSGTLSLVSVTIAMFVMNWRMALVSILSVGITSMFLGRWVAMRTRAGFRLQQSAIGAINGLVEETISGQRVVKAYGREAEVIARFDEANEEVRRSAIRAQSFAGLIGPLMNCISNISLAAVAGAGGALAVNGLATVGSVAGFISLSRQFGRPLNEVAMLMSSIQSAIAGAERVFEVIDEAPEVDDPNAEPAPAVCGDVTFENVSFSYDGATPVLRDICLSASHGQVVALVGPTGAGKTTIINLLTRFYDIDAGAVRIDGREIGSFRKDDLRRMLGIVLQDPFLFTGTVRENIRYGRLEADDAAVERAARLANAETFIHRLPEGYDTELSERGSNLSQGQRQLISIARAILADHTILILDEATSSVDTRTERMIQGALRTLMADRTSFVIAHRLSTIRDADQIIVLQDGSIAERGAHAELLTADGPYSRLYRRQIGAPVA